MAPSEIFDAVKPYVPRLLAGIGGIVATLIVTAATGLLQYKPTPASITIRPDSFEVNDTREGHVGSHRPQTTLNVIGSIVYEKEGDASAGSCVLEVKFPKAGEPMNQAILYPGVVSFGQLRGDTKAAEQVDIGGGKYKRRLVFEFLSPRSRPPFADLDVVNFELNCTKAVSTAEPPAASVNLAAELCSMFRFAAACRATPEREPTP